MTNSAASLDAKRQKQIAQKRRQAQSLVGFLNEKTAGDVINQTPP